MRFFLAVLLALGLSACEASREVISRPLEVAKPVTLTPKQLASVRFGVVKSLRTDDRELAGLGRIIAGRTSTGVVVCGYLKEKTGSGETEPEKPFHGLFLGFDNASGFVVTGSGGTDKETEATLDICRRSGLELAPS